MSTYEFTLEEVMYMIPRVQLTYYGVNVDYIAHLKSGVEVKVSKSTFLFFCMLNEMETGNEIVM